MSQIQFITLAILSATAIPSYAATYNFSYNDGITNISGVLEGTAVTSNTVTVTQIDSFIQDSVSYGPWLLPQSLDELFGFTATLTPVPIISFDGSLMDLVVFDTTNANAIQIANGDVFVSTFGGPSISTFTTSEAFIASYWSLTPANTGTGNGTVPEPASIALLAAGLLGCGAWRKKAVRA